MERQEKGQMEELPNRQIHMNLKEERFFDLFVFLFFGWEWVGEGFWRGEIYISWTTGGAGSSRTGMGSSLSNSYSMGGMGFPLCLQLVLLRSKSWVRTLVVVQSLSRVWLFATPWTEARLSFTISWSLLKFMPIESLMPSNHLILCHPLLLLPSVFSSTGIFSSELALCIRGPKSWSFSISPSNEYSGLISFRTDWFDLLVKTLDSS